MVKLEEPRESDEKERRGGSELFSRSLLERPGNGKNSLVVVADSSEDTHREIKGSVATSE
jgi:hypothetical protein